MLYYLLKVGMTFQLCYSQACYKISDLSISKLFSELLSFTFALSAQK